MATRRQIISNRRKPLPLEELTAEYNLHFAPANPEERCFVDTLIRSEWLREILPDT